MNADTVLERTDDASVSTAVLLAGARAGRREDWETLVDRYSSLLWGVARSFRLGEEDAADVVQMTWLRLIENLDRIREPRALAGWLVTSCRHEASRTWRTNARCSPQDLDDGHGHLEPISIESVPGPAEMALREETTVTVRAALQELPARQRRLLAILSHFEGDADRYAEVAEAVDMPVGSIGPTRQRALRRLCRNQALVALRG